MCYGSNKYYDGAKLIQTQNNIPKLTIKYTMKDVVNIARTVTKEPMGEIPVIISNISDLKRYALPDV